MGEEVCLRHSGVCAKIGTLEGNVSKLWAKWDGMQKLVIGTLVSAILSLIGIISVFIRLSIQ